MDESRIRATVETKSGEKIILKSLADCDENALVEFNGNITGQSKTHFQPHLYTPEIIARRIERAKQELDLCYLGYAGDKVMAYFFLWNYREKVPLLGIGIINEYQNQGLGAQFMRILINDAAAAGSEGIELTTMKTNDIAFALYKKCGFQYYGDVENEAAGGKIVVERGLFLPLKEGAQRMEGPHRPPE
ncbi:MAG: GNAT family N-acetyltransferase [Spirochaetales bacterium]|jgi:ribosomal protein S18 acetylase RimI-like enzyme|nr:GNAT family N-acetyltransferase [Spirochaetales bacterium]